MTWGPPTDYNMSITLEFFGFIIDLPLRNRFSLCEGGCRIAVRAFCESQKIVISVLFAADVSCTAVSKASEIAHSSTSRVSLFFPKSTLFCLYWLRL